MNGTDKLTQISKSASLDTADYMPLIELLLDKRKKTAVTICNSSVIEAQDSGIRMYDSINDQLRAILGL